MKKINDNSSEFNKATQFTLCERCLNGEQFIEQMELTKGEVREENSIYSQIIFLLQGKLELSYTNTPLQIVEAQSFFLVPLNSEYREVAIENSSLIVFKLTKESCVDDLLSFKNEENESKVIFTSFKINEVIIKFIGLVQALLNDQFKCGSLMKLKIQELFFLLKRYYTKRELSMLFSPIQEQDLKFLALVVDKYDGTQNVEQLAELCNQSISSFTRKFTKSFGEPPYQWLNRKKSESVFCKLKNTNIPFIQISEQLGFSSLSYFHNYCQREFGSTPSKIRES